jgi:hypothetical protein
MDYGEGEERPLYSTLCVERIIVYIINHAFFFVILLFRLRSTSTSEEV